MGLCSGGEIAGLLTADLQTGLSKVLPQKYFDTVHRLRQPALDPTVPQAPPAALRAEESTKDNPRNPFPPCAWQSVQFSPLLSASSSSQPHPLFLIFVKGATISPGNHLDSSVSHKHPDSLNWLPDPLIPYLMLASLSPWPQTRVIPPSLASGHCLPVGHLGSC